MYRNGETCKENLDQKIGETGGDWGRLMIRCTLHLATRSLGLYTGILIALIDADLRPARQQTDKNETKWIYGCR
jgi:hypothetical protein